MSYNTYMYRYGGGGPSGRWRNSWDEDYLRPRNSGSRTPHTMPLPYPNCPGYPEHPQPREHLGCPGNRGHPGHPVWSGGSGCSGYSGRLGRPECLEHPAGPGYPGHPGAPDAPDGRTFLLGLGEPSSGRVRSGASRTSPDSVGVSYWRGPLQLEEPEYGKGMFGILQT